MTRHRAYATFAFLLISLSTIAQAPAAAPAAPPAVDSQATVAADNGSARTSLVSELDQPITVAIDGLRDWMTATGKAPRDLRLYLAGQKLTKTAPTLASVRDEYVKFQLDMNAEDRDAWVHILYEARQASDHKIPLSVGLSDNMQAFDSDVELQLNVYPRYTPYILSALVGLLVVMLVLSVRTDLLRDGVNPPPLPARLPFNLGRVQMAFWFYLVIVAYLYVWMITGEYNTLTNSVLALVGISAGTGLAAVFVDTQKVQEALDQRVTLETQQISLTARIAQLTALAAPAGSTLDTELQEKSNTLLEVQAKLGSLPPPPKPALSQGFVKDILSSGDGVGFHRFQMAVWTLVLGIIFVRSVYRELTMPNFDSSLLGLMGLSSGTYVGFKIPEKPK